MRHVDVFIEPEDEDDSSEPEKLEAQNHFLVSVLFLNFHAVVSSPLTALAMVLNQSS
jgi:hypothetical protein